MNQQKKLRITMINFFSFYSIKLFPHVITGKVFFSTDQTTFQEEHSQPSTVWKKYRNKHSISDAWNRNLHFYSNICIQTHCTYSNQHTSATLSNYHLSQKNCLFWKTSYLKFIKENLQSKIQKLNFKIFHIFKRMFFSDFFYT